MLRDSGGNRHLVMAAGFNFDGQSDTGALNRVETLDLRTMQWTTSEA